MNVLEQTGHTATVKLPGMLDICCMMISCSQSIIRITINIKIFAF